MRVPVQNSGRTNAPEKYESDQIIDETADSRKTRQSAQVFDNTLFMVLGEMTKDGKYSQDKLLKILKKG